VALDHQESGGVIEVFVEYVLRVRLAFVKQACPFGHRGAWTMVEIREVCQRFLSRFTSVARLEKVPWLKQTNFSGGGWGDDLLPWFEGELRKSPRWQEHEDLLRGVADAQSKSVPNEQGPRPKLKPPFRDNKPGTAPRRRGRVGPSKTTARLKAKADADAVTRRASERQAVVMPILKGKRWRRGKLVTVSGAGKATVYGYLDGTRARIEDHNRKAIAESLGIEVGKLPD
jgi:hypothetical protein